MTSVSDEGGGSSEVGGGNSSLAPWSAGVFIGCWSGLQPARANEHQATSEQAILHSYTSERCLSLIFSKTSIILTAFSSKLHF